MFLHLLRLESEKLFKRRLFWVGLSILLAVIAFYFVMFYVYRGMMPASVRQYLFWPGSLIYALNFVSGYFTTTSWGLVLLMIVVSTVTAQEYSWRTMQLWFSRGVPRPLLLAAKLLVSLLPALLTVLSCLLIGALLSAIFSYQLQGTVSAGSVNYGQLLLAILRTTYTLLPYIALTVLLTIMTRSLAAAICGSLVFVLVIETALNIALPLLGKPFAQAAQYLPFNLVVTLDSQNVALANQSVPPGSPFAPNPGVAAIGIALYTALFCGIAFWALQRQDLAN